MTDMARRFAGASDCQEEKRHAPVPPLDAASLVTQGVDPGADRYLTTFPFLGTPKDGFGTPSA